MRPDSRCGSIPGAVCPAGALAGAILLLGLMANAAGDVPATRQGAVRDGRTAEMQAGLTVTGQDSEGPAGPELLASLDLVADLAMGPGLWTLYVEGNTSPEPDGAWAADPGINADAGTALDGAGRGRLQVSELYYGLRRGRWQGVAGLLDPTGFLDRSAVANDETAQFLSAPLVNNPAIAFPDYTLGAAVHRDYAGGALPGWTLVVTGSHGLADQPERTYAELFDLDGPGEGLFAATQGYWQGGPGALRLGAWVRTERGSRRDRPSGTARPAGAYVVADWLRAAPLRLGLRAGWARPEAAEVSGFLGLAADYRLGRTILGGGWTRSRIGDRLGQAGGSRDQAEVYLRLPVRGNGHLTPHLQWLDPVHDSARWVAGARSTWLF